MFSELNGTKFQSYTTVQGNRWDTIATLAWGEPGEFKRIIECNPGVPLTPILPGGIVLKIPIVPQKKNNDINKLPPWKRPELADNSVISAVKTLLTLGSTAGAKSYDDSFDNSFD